MTEPIPAGSPDEAAQVAATGNAPLRQRHIEPIMRTIAKGVAAHVREAAVSPQVLGHMLAETEQRMEAKIAEATKPLLERISELEKRKTMSYRGVWAAEELYHQGDFVTDHGSLWHCSEASIGARPGSSSAWKLTIKRGGDGRK